MIPATTNHTNPVFNMLAQAAAVQHAAGRGFQTHSPLAAPALDLIGDKRAAAEQWLQRHPAAQHAGNIPDFVLQNLAALIPHPHGSAPMPPEEPMHGFFPGSPEEQSVGQGHPLFLTPPPRNVNAGPGRASLLARAAAGGY